MSITCLFSSLFLKLIYNSFSKDSIGVNVPDVSIKDQGFNEVICLNVFPALKHQNPIVLTFYKNTLPFIFLDFP